MGTGAAGLGALAMLPSTSAFNIRSNNPLEYYNSSSQENPNFSVDTTGKIDAEQANLTELIADRVKASNELQIPTKSTKTTDNNQQIWLDKSNQQLKTRYNNTTYKTNLISTAIPESGIARYTLDNGDTSSGTAIDVWGDNDGTINGPTTGVSGANQTYSTNEAYSFDGVDDNVEIFSDSGFGEITDTFALALWINPDDSNSTSESSNDRVYSASAKILLRWHAAQDQFFIFDSTGTKYDVGFSGSYAAGSWNHIVAQYDGSDLELYVDSTLDNSNNIGSISLDDSGQTSFGATGAGGEAYNGDIDDLRLYDRGLTSTEISNLYNTGRISG